MNIVPGPPLSLLRECRLMLMLLIMIIIMFCSQSGEGIAALPKRGRPAALVFALASWECGGSFAAFRPGAKISRLSLLPDREMASAFGAAFFGAPAGSVWA